WPQTWLWLWHVFDLPFPDLPPGSQGPCVAGSLVSHAIQPSANHVPCQNGCGLAHQHQESSLEGILSVLVMAEQAAADAPDHRSVACNQSLQRGLIAIVNEVVQQLTIG